MSEAEQGLASKLNEQHLDEVDSDNEGPGHPLDPNKAKRTYEIFIQNQTGLPVQVVQWPVRSDTKSDYTLQTHQGVKFGTSVPPEGTIFSPSADSPEPHHIASFVGPRSLDPRHRWGWTYIDIVTEKKRRVHLQLFIHATRKGVDKALVGRTDLSSTDENPMPSGAFEPAGVISEDDRRVIFTLTPALNDVQNTVDSTIKAALTHMDAKGVDTISYVSAELGRASLIVGKEARYHEYEPPSSPALLSRIKSSSHYVAGVSEKFIGVFVERDGQSWWEGSVKVEPLTGVASGKGGLDVTAKSTVLFTKGITLNYGFHDAGEKRADQLYVYATPNHSSWLGDLIASNPAWLDVPFSRLALPAAHDSGMFGPLDPGLGALIQSGQLGNELSRVQSDIASPLVKYLVDALELVKLKPDRVINNIALTQKDSFEDQLKIGVRFFDFRPGYCFSDVIHLKKEIIHHQHAMVPGCTYLNFLTSILTFLASHPQEIVFTELKSDGFVVLTDKMHNNQITVYSMIPTPEELASVWDAACQAVPSSTVKIGSALDLDRPIGELIKDDVRLLIVNKVQTPDAWPRNDSYDHHAYNTTDPATIIAMLEKTFAASSHSDPPVEGVPARGCIYQLQATPTASIKDDVEASFTYSDSSSWLTYMKPRQDAQTYPWIASHTFKEPGNVVFLNDFVDGVLVEHAIAVSRQRTGL